MIDVDEHGNRTEWIDAFGLFPEVGSMVAYQRHDGGPLINAMVVSRDFLNDRIQLHYLATRTVSP